MEYLDPPDEGMSHCVILPVREDKQIKVRLGDVVGYYVDHFRRDDDDDDDIEERNDGGIEWIQDDTVSVYYREDLQQQNIKPFYAGGWTKSN